LAPKFLDIERHINTNNAMIFTTNKCPDCKTAKKLLQKKGVQTLSMNLDLNADGSEYKVRLPEFCGEVNYPMVFVAGEFVGGLEDLKKLSKKHKNMTEYIKKRLDPPAREDAKDKAKAETDAIKDAVKGAEEKVKEVGKKKDDDKLADKIEKAAEKSEEKAAKAADKVADKAEKTGDKAGAVEAAVEKAVAKATDMVEKAASAAEGAATKAADAGAKADAAASKAKARRILNGAGLLGMRVGNY